MTNPTSARRFIVETIARVAERCIDHPRLVLATFVILAVGGILLAATGLRVDTNPSLIISNEPKFSRDYQKFVRQFPVLHNDFLIVVETEEAGTGRRIAGEIAERLEARSDLFSNVFAPGSAAFFDRYGLLYMPESDVARVASDIEELAPLLNTLSFQPNVSGLDDLVRHILPTARTGRTPKELARLLDAMADASESFNNGQTRALDWTSLGNRSPEIDESRWFVFANPMLDYSAIDAAGGPIHEVRSLIDEIHRKHPDVKVQVTGEAAIDVEEYESISRGAVTAAVISFTLVTLVIVIGLPSLVLLVPALTLIVLGFFMTAGFAALSIGHLNIISVAFATLFIGLGIDYAVHVIFRFAEERAGHAAPRDAALIAIRKTALPLVLCTVTTSLAFLSFGLTDFVGMAQFGVISSGGVVIAFLASVTLVPAILVLVPTDAQKLADKLVSLRSSRVRNMGSGGSSMIRLAMLAIVVAAALGALGLKDVRFDGNPLNLKDPEAPSMVAFEELSQGDPGLSHAVQFVARPGGELEQLIERAKGLPVVSDIRTFSAVLPHNQDNKLELLRKAGTLVPSEILPTSDMSAQDRRDHFLSIGALAERIAAIPSASREVRRAAKRLAAGLDVALAEAGARPERLAELETALLEGFPALFSDIRRVVTLEEVTSSNIARELKERYITKNGLWRVEILPGGNMRNPDELDGFVAAVSDLHPDITGLPIDITGSADVVISAMRTASIAALLLVCLVLFPVLGNFRSVLLVLVPLVLAGLLVVGYSVIANAPFNFANVIVIPLLIGLGVDSAIHCVLRTTEGEGTVTEISKTWTPHAVLVSAITTMGSFGTLWISQHRGLASMGELLSISIVAMLLCTLFVLPRLIGWTARFGR